MYMEGVIHHVLFQVLSVQVCLSDSVGKGLKLLQIHMWCWISPLRSVDKMIAATARVGLVIFQDHFVWTVNVKLKHWAEAKYFNKKSDICIYNIYTQLTDCKQVTSVDFVVGDLFLWRKGFSIVWVILDTSDSQMHQFSQLITSSLSL